MRFLLILWLFSLAACASQNIERLEAEPPGLGANHSTPMTAEECVAANGVVVGDIGDGRIHRSDYLCVNGDVPLGTIIQKAGEPMAVEGAVCCGQ